MSIIKDEGAVFDQIMEDPEFIREQLNLRNVDGKSPLFLAIEHGRRDMFDKLFAEKFLEHLDLRSKDTIHGNTPLHIACEKEEADVARKIFEFEEELCMQPNFQGRSPFFVAC
jgi:ankyrin repeat protein